MVIMKVQVLTSLLIHRPLCADHLVRSQDGLSGRPRVPEQASGRRPLPSAGWTALPAPHGQTRLGHAWHTRQ